MTLTMTQARHQMLGELANKAVPPHEATLASVSPELRALVQNLATYTNTLSVVNQIESVVVQTRAFLMLYRGFGVIYTGNCFTFCSLAPDGTMLCTDRFWAADSCPVSSENPFSLLETMLRFILAPFADIPPQTPRLHAPLTRRSTWWQGFLNAREEGNGAGLDPISLMDVVEGGAGQLAVRRIEEVCRARLQGIDAVVKMLARTNRGRDKDDPPFQELERDMDRELEACDALARARTCLASFGQARFWGGCAASS